MAELYVEDETAWLEEMAARIDAGAHSDLDYASLREYLTDMAKRDRREVRSRLLVLLLHALKWEQQPDHRSGSWKGSILVQQSELRDLASGGVLRTHADDVLPEAYIDAVRAAAAETGLPVSTFPADCPWTFDDLLAFVPAE
jgi:hypothetical protein